MWMTLGPDAVHKVIHARATSVGSDVVDLDHVFRVEIDRVPRRDRGSTL
jgi:hypothetical protein